MTEGGRRTAGRGRRLASQAYYWQPVWQRDEQETLASLKAGNGRTFESGADAIRWLLSDED